MSSETIKTIANAVIFQVGWILSVLYGSTVAVLVAVIAAVIYGVWFLRNRYELILIICIAVIGIVGDTLLGLFDVFHFPSDSFLPPVWMMVLWLLFASTIPWALRWLVKHRLWFTLLCAISGPLSYLGGVAWSAVTFGQSRPVAIAVLVAVWLIHGAVISTLYHRVRDRF